MKNIATLRIEKMVKECCPGGRWYVFLIQKEIKFCSTVDAEGKSYQDFKYGEFLKKVAAATETDCNLNFEDLTIKDAVIAVQQLKFTKKIKEEYGITAEFAGPNIYLKY